MPCKTFLQYYGLISAFLTICLLQILPFFAYNPINEIYRPYLFPIIKTVLQPFHWLPFPALYVLVGIVLLWILKVIVDGGRWYAKILKIANILGLLVTLFYVCWAFQYKAKSLRELLLDNQPLNIEQHAFFSLYDELNHALGHVRDQILVDTLKSIPMKEDAIQTDLICQQRRVLEKLGFSTHVPAKIKALPKGWLLRFSTAGFYFPHGGEGYYDAGLPAIDIPFVMAHELAHNFGVTDEGEANFIAFLTCMNSDNIYIQYAGLFNFWEYAYSSLKRYYPTEFEYYKEHLNAKVRNDKLYSIQEKKRYPDILPDLRDAIYGSYLKSQGVSAGLGSYAEIIQLELLYRRTFRASVLD